MLSKMKNYNTLNYKLQNRGYITSPRVQNIISATPDGKISLMGDIHIDYLENRS
jgi:hypothetical protein